MNAIGSVLVAGGGIAGLVSARALALSGLRVTVLERRAEITDEGGIGIGIQSNAMDALGSIGLAQSCVDEGVPVETICVHAPNGAVVAEQSIVRHFGTSWPGFTGMRRSALHAILVKGAIEAGVTLLTNADVVEVDQDTTSVGVMLADGRRFSGDLLVGADGIHSSLRALLFPAQARALPTREGVWRAFIAGEARSEVRIMYGGGGVGTIGYTPLRDGTYLYVVNDQSRAPDRDDQHLADRLTQLIGDVPGFPAELMRQLSPTTAEVSYRRLQTVSLAAPWHIGRIVLIGDAAHAGPPTLAQGAAMGIEDGVVLAQTLNTAGDLADALAEYMRRRFERVRTIMDASIVISQAQMEPDGRERMIEAQRAAAAALALPY